MHTTLDARGNAGESLYGASGWLYRASAVLPLSVHRVRSRSVLKMIRMTLVVAFAASCFVVSTAFADDKQVCSEAYANAQNSRDAHKFMAARAQLRVCAGAQCPGFMAKDCAGWLKDVEPRIPSVVFVAKNAAGSDL